MTRSTLGIRRLHGIELCVRDAEPWMAYLTQAFGFQQVAVSTGPSIEQSGTCRRVLCCGDVCMVVRDAVHAGSAVRRYLERHPEGLSRVNFLVDDIEATESYLAEHHAAVVHPVVEEPAGGGLWKYVTIATPMSDVEFRFVETSGEVGRLMPGTEPSGSLDPAYNPIGLVSVDHLTINAPTLMPFVAFFEHVLGMTRFWNLRFHAEDVTPGLGGGLKSVVMRDEQSGVKFAINEPLRPRFAESQVYLQVEANRGPGIQHVALSVEDLPQAVDHCARSRVEFMQVLRSYYRALPARVRASGVPAVAHDLEELESRSILLDGDRNGYVLQAFCKDQATQFKRSDAGSVFIELIQRCGSQGFGEGNFRALFEAARHRA
jgi:4-hydroxyphenylpyruvate dioxygenase